MSSTASQSILSKENALLHELLDYNMLHNSDQVYFTFAFPGQNELVEVTYLEFGRAVHRVAHYVRPDPFAGKDNEVIAILANIGTLAYHAITMGTLRSGLTPFPMSHRNSAAAVISMLQKTDCHRILTTPRSDNPTMDALIDAIREECPSNYALSIEYIPHADAIYPHLGRESTNDTFDAYPLKERSLDDVAVYLHSSGSTGFPKPIPETFKTILLCSKMEVVTDRVTANPPLSRIGTFGLPPFHAFAFFIELISCLATSLGVCILPPTSATLKGDTISISSAYALPLAPTSDNIIENARVTGVEGIMSVPTFLDNWATEASEEKFDFLRKIRIVTFAGGPLAYEKGQLLVDQGIRVRSLYGGTEFSIVSHLLVEEDTDNKDWNYIKFSKRAHIDWVPQHDNENSEENIKTFELRVLPCETHNVAITNYVAEMEVNGKTQKISGYATSDLLQRHPTKENLWKIVGRQDDVLILSTGEKTVPAPIEQAIVSDKRIKSAVLFGRGREQVGVLIEPASYDQDPAAFIESIWPTIEASTVDSPAFSRIFKHLVLVTREDKPMLRTDKGTIKKKATIAAYAEEIDALYDAAEKRADIVEPPRSWSEEDLTAWLVIQAQALLPSTSNHRINISRSVFEQGFDSLSATFFRNQIIGALRHPVSAGAVESPESLAKALPLNIIFSHANIDDLAKYLSHLVLAGGATVSSEDEVAQKTKAIENTIERLSVGFEGQKRVGPLITPAVILLTGTTGGLGSFLLASLLQDAKVKRVYAFNRPGKKPTKQRQVEAFADRDLPVHLLEGDKIVFVEGDSATDKLGLDSSVYEEIRSSVTAIIHNAWRLDFNLALSSFEPHLLGTRRLIDLALTSANVDSIRFLFTSSIGTTQSWPREKGPYPEEPQHEAKYAVGSGYGEGKYVCERVLENSGLQATSFRIGQMSGPVPSGYWATTDWVALLAKSSVAMGSFPDLAGTAAWVPFTAVSNAITDTLFHPNIPPLALNVVHPRPAKWTSIMLAVREAVVGTTKTAGDAELPLAPFSQWFAQLEAAAQTPSEKTLQNMPAVKIIDFFSSFLAGESKENEETTGSPLLTNKMQAISETIRDLRPLGSQDARAWVQYWNSKGLFDFI